MKKLLIVCLFLGVSFAVKAQAQSIHYPGEVALIKSAAAAMNFDLVPPPTCPPQGCLYIVKQAFPGGPISVYRTDERVVGQIVEETPDGGTSPNGKTKYLVGTPYLTTATQSLENNLYIGK